MQNAKFRGRGEPGVLGSLERGLTPAWGAWRLGDKTPWEVGLRRGEVWPGCQIKTVRLGNRSYSPCQGLPSALGGYLCAPSPRGGHYCFPFGRVSVG